MTTTTETNCIRCGVRTAWAYRTKISGGTRTVGAVAPRTTSRPSGYCKPCALVRRDELNAADEIVRARNAAAPRNGGA